MPRLLLWSLSLCLLLAGGPVHAQSASQVGFGRAVAVGADHAFVGSPQDVNTPGRVYVYSRDAEGAWQERTFLEARDGRVRDGFGTAIETAEDRLVVGAPAANAVYLFQRADEGWEQAARLTPSDSTRGFGRSLSLVGNRLFVGTEATVAAAGGDTTRTGAVHLFRRDGAGTWTEARVLRSDWVQAESEFGASLIASGEHLLVGAPEQEDGAVVAFRRGPDGWTDVQILTAAGLGGAARFGSDRKSVV